MILTTKDLIPDNLNEDAMNYTPGPYACPLLKLTSSVSTKTKNNITVKDVLKFFVQYMKNDQLGMIANAHLGKSNVLNLSDMKATADFYADGVKNNRCIGDLSLMD